VCLAVPWQTRPPFEVIIYIYEKLIKEKLVIPLLKEAEELTKVFVKSRKTVKNGSLEFAVKQ